jgi:general secretion pathway protein H
LLGAARRGGRGFQAVLDSGRPQPSKGAPKQTLLMPVQSKNPFGATHQLRHAGFTLLELLVVVAIIAVATAGVTLSLRDSSQTALEREAQRLAVLFESARAQSRASGTAVFWRPTLDGFRFEGLPPGALPTRWLEAGTRAGANLAIQLGPEPIIGAQAVDILSGGQDQGQPARVLRIATDGLRPFALQTTEQQP